MEVMTVDAELRVPAAVAQIARFQVQDAQKYVYCEESYWLDLCLTPRPNLRCRDLDSWEPHHFKNVGALLLIPASRPYEFRSESGVSTSIVCQLRRDFFRRWLDDDLDWNGQPFEAGLNMANAHLRALLHRLASEMRNPGVASETLSELIFGQLAIELSRHCDGIRTRACSGGLAPWRLKLIDEYLTEGMTPPALSHLAKLCNLSVRQLTRGFRTSRGCTFGTYAAQKRIEHAKRLLASDASLTAIAHSMGFGSQSAFTYAFRRATGNTPHQYRKQVLNWRRGLAA